MITQKQIGRNIKRYRKESGVTQRELASAIGYKDYTSLAYIEAGTKSISAEKLSLVADYLHTPISCFMEQNDADTYPTSIEG